MRAEFVTSAIALGLFVYTCFAIADPVKSHLCERYDLNRIVELHADNDTGAPCRILYYKPMEDQSVSNLWRAQNDAQFCLNKYSAFITKLESKLNWSCKPAESLAQVPPGDKQPEYDKVTDQKAAAVAVPIHEDDAASKGVEDIKNTTTPLDGQKIPGAALEIADQEVAELQVAPVQKIEAQEDAVQQEASNVAKTEEFAKPIARSIENPTASITDRNDDSSSIVTSIDSSERQFRPDLASALPVNPTTDGQSPELSMNLIKQSIPSGKYLSTNGQSHQGNTSLCPADGFFIWNTRAPEKPVFEMGADHEFQFDLTSLSNLSTSTRARSLVSNQCQLPFFGGYCSDGKYVGQDSPHPALSLYFGCNGRAENSQDQRSLVLMRSLYARSQSTPGCEISEDYYHMALASSNSTTESTEIAEKHDIELVILHKNSNANSLKSNEGAVCRYVRGG